MHFVRKKKSHGINKNLAHHTGLIHPTHLLDMWEYKPPNSEIICVQNVGAKVEMVSYLKKLIKIKILKREKDPGGRLGSTS